MADAPTPQAPRAAAPRRRERRRWLPFALLLGAVVGLGGAAVLHWPPAWNLEARWGIDVLFLLRGQIKAQGVRVVAIDRASADVLLLDDNKPVPREKHAELIRTLKKAGARAVAFDVLMEGPQSEEGDRELAAAMKETGNVVLGADVQATIDPRFREIRIVEPYEPLKNAAAALGNVGLLMDKGVIRRTALFQEGRPSLALAAYEVATGDTSQRSAQQRLIDYYGAGRSIETVSYYQALSPEELRRGYFEGQVVFVGAADPAASSADDIKDLFATPFSKDTLTYGVEIHATIAANLLEGRRIDPLPDVAEAALLVLLGLIASVVFIGLRPDYGALAFAGFELLWWTGARLAFSRAHALWVPVIIPAAMLPLAYGASLVWYYLTIAREKERIRRAFTFYLSPEMIARIVADPSSLNLGGEEIVATAIFTDVKGFTSIAESMAAPETAALLNDYFSRLTRFVFDEGGTLIKYIGDAVFAIWGAPLRMDDHAVRACTAALAMARDQESQEGGGRQVSLVTRIGVHTGPMLVGNLGSEQRFDYTAIGDAVNTASRLEGLNKYFTTRAIVSEAALALTGGAFLVRSLGRVLVVGKTEPLAIYELLGRRGETLAASAAYERYEKALADFTARRFEQAAEGFREARTLRGEAGDGPSEFYIEQCAAMLAEPPPADWDGAVTFAGK
jgi:adenylate cyclase